jgi:hypothetical protein
MEKKAITFNRPKKVWENGVYMICCNLFCKEQEMRTELKEKAVDLSVLSQTKRKEKGIVSYISYIVTYSGV